MNEGLTVEELVAGKQALGMLALAGHRHCLEDSFLSVLVRSPLPALMIFIYKQQSKL